MFLESYAQTENLKQLNLNTKFSIKLYLFIKISEYCNRTSLYIKTIFALSMLQLREV